MVIVIEHILSLPEKIIHRMARSDIWQEPERMRKHVKKRGMGEWQHWFLRTKLQIVDVRFCKSPSNKIEPFLYLVLILESSLATFPIRGEEKVEIKLIKLSFNCNF